MDIEDKWKWALEENDGYHIIVKKLWIGGLLSKQISMRISKCMASTATFVSNTKFAMPWMVSIHQAADRGIWANVPPPPPKKEQI